MKTRNNQLVTLAFFAFLFLIGVNAEGTEKTVSSHENIEEKSLEIENWMMKEGNWNISSFAYEVSLDADKAMELENWMLTDSNWDVKINQELYMHVQEDAIQLENWMTDKFVWMVPDNEEKEAALALQDWMENDKVWFR